MTIELRAYSFPPYKQMVLNLFKKDLQGHYAILMHAAIGVAGEAGELKKADSRKNILEECGDIEFYIQGALNGLEEAGHPFVHPDFINGQSFTAGNWLEVIHITSSDFLDFVKKAWVYGNREPNFAGVYVALRDLREALDFGYAMMGTSMDEVQYLNQVKLIGKDGRYKNGTYSDAEALARNDKVAEEKAARLEVVNINTSDVGDLGSVLGLGGVEHQPRFADKKDA